MKSPQPSFRRRGFTLVEILVSLAVLVLLMVFIAQITNNATTAIRLSNQTSTTDSDARTAFSVIGYDLQNMVKRSDVDCLAGNPSGRANYGAYQLLFFSNTAAALPTGVASTANRNISLVGYQIGTSPNSSNSTLPCLLRAGMPIQWTTTGFMGLNVLGLPVKFGDPAVSPSPAFPAALLPNAANTPSDFDVVAPGVIGMVVGFQLYPDNQTVNLENGSAVLNAKAQGQWEYSPPIRQITSTTGIPQSAGGYYLDMSRVSSIMIGLVVVDRATLKMLNATQVQKIVNPNNWSQGQFIVPNENQTPLQAWNNTLNTLATNPNLLGPGGVPLPALQSMRIYECVFPVTPEASVFGE